VKKLLFTLSFIFFLSAIGISSYASRGTWKRDNKGWWYLLNNGTYCVNTWFQDSDSQWYYFNGNGYMVYNQWVGDYYLGDDGAMFTDRMTPDGYWVGSDGKWNPDTNNLAGLTGKFWFALDHVNNDIFAWDGDTLHIRGFLSSVSGGGKDLGYTEEFLEVTDSSQFFLLSGNSIKAYLTKEQFKNAAKLDSHLSLYVEVYSGNIIGAGLAN